MENKQYKGKNIREHYRIRYPISCRPRLIILNNEYETIDISERGIRFICKKISEFQAGMELEVRVTFSNGEYLDLEGEILRTDEKVAVLHLSRRIPFKIIVAEQRYIKLNYPDYLKTSQ